MEGILGVFQVGESAPIRELPTYPLVDAPTPPHKPEATGPLRPYWKTANLKHIALVQTMSLYMALT